MPPLLPLAAVVLAVSCRLSVLCAALQTCW